MPIWGAWPDDISTDELVTAAWLTSVSQSLAFLERVARVQFISGVTISALTSATSNLIVSAGAIVFEAVPHKIVFSSPEVRRVGTANAGPQVTIGLYDNGAANGVARIANFRAGGTTGFSSDVHREYVLTPSAASHTYEIRAYVSTADTFVVEGGAGGNDVLAPGYIEIWRQPT